MARMSPPHIFCNLVFRAPIDERQYRWNNFLLLLVVVRLQHLTCHSICTSLLSLIWRDAWESQCTFLATPHHFGGFLLQIKPSEYPPSYSNTLHPYILRLSDSKPIGGLIAQCALPSQVQYSKTSVFQRTKCEDGVGARSFYSTWFHKYF